MFIVTRSFTPVDDLQKSEDCLKIIHGHETPSIYIYIYIYCIYNKKNNV